MNMSNVVRVGRIGKPHGIRGEVTVEVHSDSPDIRFAQGAQLKVRTEGGQSKSIPTLTVEGSRWNKNILLLKFIECSDRTTAESLRDVELYVLKEDSPQDDDSWYPDELIGLAVFEGSLLSARIGEVVDLIPGAAQDLLEVRLADGREVLIPFVEEIVPEINDKVGAVVITPPPGLLELNQD